MEVYNYPGLKKTPCACGILIWNPTLSHLPFRRFVASRREYLTVLQEKRVGRDEETVSVAVVGLCLRMSYALWMWDTGTLGPTHNPQPFQTDIIVLN